MKKLLSILLLSLAAFSAHAVTVIDTLSSSDLTVSGNVTNYGTIECDGTWDTGATITVSIKGVSGSEVNDATTYDDDFWKTVIAGDDPIIVTLTLSTAGTSSIECSIRD